MNEKSPEAFKSIGEVATELAIPQHVLRFWETRFPQVKPLKRGGNRRYYRPEDVALLHGIRFLLYAKGFTIKGVQRLLREQGVRFVAATASGDLSPEPVPDPEAGQEAEHAPVASVYEPELPDDLALTAPPTMARDMPPEAAEAKRRPGLGSILKRRSDPGETAPNGLSRSQTERLQAVILDLLECKRILDQVR
ncbi:MerR family transcriptional regulator [Fulvimarina endophytica]|uniref:MerR family transcriptional regulator n=1 Tax=Fulvimarina endophytica TaxID=2293836 RepID=A0A371X7C2_9HYPH|nr:MerR family transcriptional regulator [Fulvimarina endophytica]RFC65139.1 MerR family transcriptional regulator [Fulvimarina endophytica]